MNFKFLLCIFVVLALSCTQKGNKAGVVGRWHIDRITDSAQNPFVDRSKRDSMYMLTLIEHKISYGVQQIPFTQEDSLNMAAGFEQNWQMVFNKTYEFTQEGRYIIGNWDMKKQTTDYDTMNYQISGNELTMNNNGDKMTWEYRITDGGQLLLIDGERRMHTYMARIK